MIDWNRISEIIAKSPLPDWDQEIVLNAVMKAYDEWIRDSKFTPKEIELFVESPLAARIDLLAEDADGTFFVEWKSTRGKLDDRWVERETRSWQLPLYAACLIREFPVRAEIRGVRLDEEVTTRTIKRLITKNDATEAMQIARTMWKVRKIYAQRKKWLRDPSGCKCFGPQYACEFEDFCWNGKRAPEGLPGELKTLSHSSIKELLRCPERYRLLQWTEREDEEKTAAGTAFHAAMAEICRQLKEEA